MPREPERDTWTNAVITLVIPLETVSVDDPPEKKVDFLSDVMEWAMTKLGDDGNVVMSGHFEDVEDGEPIHGERSYKAEAERYRDTLEKIANASWSIQYPEVDAFKVANDIHHVAQAALASTTGEQERS